MHKLSLQNLLFFLLGEDTQQRSEDSCAFVSANRICFILSPDSNSLTLFVQTGSVYENHF